MKNKPVQLMTAEDVAKRLHISPRRLQDLLKEYPFYRSLIDYPSNGHPANT